MCPVKLWGTHVKELFCSSNPWAADSVLQEKSTLSATHVPAALWVVLRLCPNLPLHSFVESHNNKIAVQKIKHTNIYIINSLECISSLLVIYTHLYDTYSANVFQILPFSILTATVLHVDILSIPKAEASTTFPKAPWPRVLPGEGKKRLISGKVSELPVPRAGISLSVRQCN